MPTFTTAIEQSFNEVHAETVLAQQAQLRTLIEEAEQSAFAEWVDIESEIEKIFNE